MAAREKLHYKSEEDRDHFSRFTKDLMGAPPAVLDVMSGNVKRGRRKASFNRSREASTGCNGKGRKKGGNQQNFQEERETVYGVRA